MLANTCVDELHQDSHTNMAARYKMLSTQLAVDTAGNNVIGDEMNALLVAYSNLFRVDKPTAYDRLSKDICIF